MMTNSDPMEFRMTGFGLSSFFPRNTYLNHVGYGETSSGDTEFVTIIGLICWCTPLNPVLGRQRQADLYKFEVSLVYKSYFQDRLQNHRETLSQKNRKK